MMDIAVMEQQQQQQRMMQDSQQMHRLHHGMHPSSASGGMDQMLPSYPMSHAAAAQRRDEEMLMQASEAMQRISSSQRLHHQQNQQQASRMPPQQQGSRQPSSTRPAVHQGPPPNVPMGMMLDPGLVPSNSFPNFAATGMGLPNMAPPRMRGPSMQMAMAPEPYRYQHPSGMLAIDSGVPPSGIMPPSYPGMRALPPPPQPPVMLPTMENQMSSIDRMMATYSGLPNEMAQIQAAQNYASRSLQQVQQRAIATGVSPRERRDPTSHHHTGSSSISEAQQPPAAASAIKLSQYTDTPAGTEAKSARSPRVRGRIDTQPIDLCDDQEAADPSATYPAGNSVRLNGPICIQPDNIDSVEMSPLDLANDNFVPSFIPSHDTPQRAGEGQADAASTSRTDYSCDAVDTNYFEMGNIREILPLGLDSMGDDDDHHRLDDSGDDAANTQRSDSRCGDDGQRSRSQSRAPGLSDSGRSTGSDRMDMDESISAQLDGSNETYLPTLGGSTSELSSADLNSVDLQSREHTTADEPPTGRVESPPNFDESEGGDGVEHQMSNDMSMLQSYLEDIRETNDAADHEDVRF